MDPLNVTLTANEASALHIAGDLVLRVVEEKKTDGNPSLSRGVAALERALKDRGAVLTEDGWRAPDDRLPAYRRRA